MQENSAITQENSVVQENATIQEKSAMTQDVDKETSTTQADAEENETEIEKQFAKISFKEGYAGFMRDGTIKKEGLTGFFVALAIAILNTISMFIS